jgi:hypothetical protein
MSGLVFAFNECIADLVAHGLGDGEINTHPICVAFSDKFDDLARCRGLEPIPCNEPLTKLVAQFTEAMRLLCREVHETDARNQHPVVQDFVRRLVHVTGSRSGPKLFDALDQCGRIAAGR